LDQFTPRLERSLDLSLFRSIITKIISTSYSTFLEELPMFAKISNRHPRLIGHMIRVESALFPEKIQGTIYMKLLLESPADIDTLLNIYMKHYWIVKLSECNQEVVDRIRQLIITPAWWEAFNCLENPSDIIQFLQTDTILQDNREQKHLLFIL